jgi:hypothetical protein
MSKMGKIDRIEISKYISNNLILFYNGNRSHYEKLIINEIDNINIGNSILNVSISNVIKSIIFK